jgi:hypothetical protein
MARQPIVQTAEMELAGQILRLEPSSLLAAAAAGFKAELL